MILVFLEEREHRPGFNLVTLRPLQLSENLESQRSQSA